MKPIRLAAFLVILFLSTGTPPLAHAAEVAAAGSQTLALRGDPPSIPWRNGVVELQFQPDGELGTLAYGLFKTQGPDQKKVLGPGLGADQQWMTALIPDWLTFEAAGDEVNAQINFGYQPWLSPEDATAPDIRVGFGGRSYSGKMSPGERQPLYSFGFGAGVPEDLLLTVAVGPEYPPSFPNRLILEQTEGSGSGVSEIEVQAAKFQTMSFYTFSLRGVKSGDRFLLSAIPNGENELMINGWMIDEP